MNISQLKKRIELECIAGAMALSGFSLFARHRYITKRMELAVERNRKSDGSINFVAVDKVLTKWKTT